MSLGLLCVALFTTCFAMLAKRLSATVLTAPMVFIAFGYLMSTTGLLPHEEAETGLHVVAEIALVLLLFLDASQIDLMALRERHVWAVRMLLVGLPLAIAFGTLAAIPFLPDWPIFAVALVAAILAPTDAALGQAVVANPIVPERARRALTVESGLNDGLALPIVLFFSCLTAQVTDAHNVNWYVFTAQQLSLGPLAGVLVGLTGGGLLVRARSLNLTSDTFEGIAAIAIAGLAYLAAGEIGGNGFIAAFVAGLCYGNVVKDKCKFSYEFTESEGQLLSWAAFFLLGLALLPDALAHLDAQTFGLILVSLFVVRPLAIWISLIGTKASTETRLFFGWFGPRGLATALFALLVVKSIDVEYSEAILLLAVNAVWISALLHGLSALPGAKWYSSRVSEMGDCPETEKITSSAKPLITHSL